VRGLVLFVVDIAHEDRRQAVEGEHAVGLGVADAVRPGLAACRRGVVGVLLRSAPGRALETQLGQQPLLDAGHDAPMVLPFLNHCLKLRLRQFFVQPAGLERGLG
jgi:hypothetical protein